MLSVNGVDCQFVFMCMWCVCVCVCIRLLDTALMAMGHSGHHANGRPTNWTHTHTCTGRIGLEDAAVKIELHCNLKSDDAIVNGLVE